MSTQEKFNSHLIRDQINAAVVGVINDHRIHDETLKLASQDEALYKAVAQIDHVRDFLRYPDRILGSELTKHGEIAEQVEVGIRNAKAALLHQDMPATFKDVDRFAPADYLINNTAVQSKFINGISNNLDHVLEHMDKYPNFGRDSSYYHIPKDTFETILKVKNGLPTDLSERSKTAILNKLRLIEEQSGKSFESVVQPSTSTYAEVQQGKVHETLNNHEQVLEKDNSKIKESIRDDHKPSLTGAAEAAVIAGTVGGILSFGTA